MRELTLPELNVVSGGQDESRQDTVVVTGTRIRRDFGGTSGIPSNFTFIPDETIFGNIPFGLDFNFTPQVGPPAPTDNDESQFERDPFLENTNPPSSPPVDGGQFTGEFGNFDFELELGQEGGFERFSVTFSIPFSF